MNKKNNTIAIVGGGNSSHSLIPLLSFGGHKVNLLTRKPELWSQEIEMEYILPSGEIKGNLRGSINHVSDRPELIIPNSDIIILCLPVAKYRTVLDKIAPFINTSKKIYIGSIYGQAGFNWIVDEVKNKYHLKNIVTFSCGEIPWNNRTKEYGKVGLNYVPKAVNIAAVYPYHEFEVLNNLIFDDLSYSWFKMGKFKQADNFISLTLSVDNQIIHLSRLYGLFLSCGGIWKKNSDVPYFYRDYDDISADLLKDVDDDYTKIRERIKYLFPNKDFTYMLNYLDLERLCNNSSNTDIKESFITSKTLWQISTPTIQNEKGEWVFDKDHRFFSDDLYYGLAIAKWIAEKLLLNVPTIDKILEWAQKVLGVKIIEKGKLLSNSINLTAEFASGIPSVYGFSTIEELID